MTAYFGFLKIFEKEEWAEQFLKGKLYCNTLRYFRAREQSEDGRGDPLEGASALIHPWEAKITISSPKLGLPPILLDSSNLAGPVVMHLDAHLDQRVFCMYAIHFNDNELRFETKDADDAQQRIEIVKQRFRLDERCYGLGTHAVFIHDARRFLEALGACADKIGKKIQHGLVKYYDDTKGGPIRSSNPVFQKSHRFDYQREYRLAFEHDGAGAFELDVGDMRAFAVKIPAQQLRDIQCEVELYEQAEEQ